MNISIESSCCFVNCERTISELSELSLGFFFLRSKIESFIKIVERLQAELQSGRNGPPESKHKSVFNKVGATDWKNMPQ